jgi:stress-induced-phosphoprotein 1
MENEKKSYTDQNSHTKQKDLANQHFKDGKYNEAIEVYSKILDLYNENNENENNETCNKHIILSNRAAAYIKLEKWDDAFIDAHASTKLKPDWGKAWGRLGAALYGQNKLDEALVVYTKANELEPSEIYTQMIATIKDHIIKIKDKMISMESICGNTNPSMENIFSKIFDSVMHNPKIMEKLIDPEFQNKVLSLQTNPMEALKDKDVMNIMSEMIKNLDINN